MPKNAHAHFILGLMFQRLGQSQKAIPEYEKAEEILLGCEPEIARPELLLLVQIHHGQCLLLDGFGDTDSVKELEGEELEEILSKLKDSIKLDVRQAAVWNTLGLMLLKAGCLMSAISVLSSLLALVPDNYDCLANLGVAYLQRCRG
ncbi:putative tetratricopeptide-like helical domain superfamily [Arabidopsis thaliana]